MNKIVFCIFLLASRPSFSEAEKCVSYSGEVSAKQFFKKTGLKTPEFCQEAKISNSSCEYQTVRGASGRSYKVKEFGGMCWFVESLKEVPSEFSESPEWEDRSNNGWYGNYGPLNLKNSKNKSWFGKLFSFIFPDPPIISQDTFYTFAAAMNSHECTGQYTNCSVSRTQGACPTGWHVPSRCEYEALFSALGADIYSEDRKVVEKSASALNDPNLFNWQVNGYVTSDGGLGGVGSHSDTWTSLAECDGSDKPTGDRINIHLSYYHASKEVLVRSFSAANAYTIRCIKN